MTEFFEFQSRTKILSGRGALLHLAAEIRLPIVYTEIPTDSSLSTANKIAGICRKNDIDMIIGLGGGSVIDTAKGVRMILSQNSDDILKLSGYEGLPRRQPRTAVHYSHHIGNRFRSHRGSCHPG